MKTYKNIAGNIVLKNKDHAGMWDIMETRGGQLSGKSTFTGSMKEVRGAIKEGNRLAEIQSR